jgi:hypothetical protein
MTKRGISKHNLVRACQSVGANFNPVRQSTKEGRRVFVVGWRGQQIGFDELRDIAKWLNSIKVASHTATQKPEMLNKE